MSENTWVSTRDVMPTAFLSVLGHIEDNGQFPTVRECYSVGIDSKKFFFPALGEFHPVSHWMPMPEPPIDK